MLFIVQQQQKPQQYQPSLQRCEWLCLRRESPADSLKWSKSNGKREGKNPQSAFYTNQLNNWISMLLFCVWKFFGGWKTQRDIFSSYKIFFKLLSTCFRSTESQRKNSSECTRALLHFIYWNKRIVFWFFSFVCWYYHFFR